MVMSRLYYVYIYVYDSFFGNITPTVHCLASPYVVGSNPRKRFSYFCRINIMRKVMFIIFVVKINRLVKVVGHMSKPNTWCNRLPIGAELKNVLYLYKWAQNNKWLSASYLFLQTSSLLNLFIHNILQESTSCMLIVIATFSSVIL